MTPCDTCLVVEWLRHYALNAGGPGWTPGQGNKIPHITTKILHTATKTQHSQTNKY